MIEHSQLLKLLCLNLAYVKASTWPECLPLSLGQVWGESHQQILIAVTLPVVGHTLHQAGRRHQEVQDHLNTTHSEY